MQPSVRCQVAMSASLRRPGLQARVPNEVTLGGNEVTSSVSGLSLVTEQGPCGLQDVKRSHRRGESYGECLVHIFMGHEATLRTALHPQQPNWVVLRDQWAKNISFFCNPS